MEYGYVRIKTYDETINYLLETYATEGNIWRSHNGLITLRERPNQDPLALARVILPKSCRCRLLYGEKAITRVLIEGMKDAIRNQTRRFSAMNPGMTFDNMALYASDVDARTDGWKCHQHPTDKGPKTRNKNNSGRNSETNYTKTNIYGDTTVNEIEQNRG